MKYILIGFLFCLFLIGTYVFIVALYYKQSFGLRPNQCNTPVRGDKRLK